MRLHNLLWIEHQHHCFAECSVPIHMTAIFVIKVIRVSWSNSFLKRISHFLYNHAKQNTFKHLFYTLEKRARENARMRECENEIDIHIILSNPSHFTFQYSQNIIICFWMLSMVCRWLADGTYVCRIRVYKLMVICLFVGFLAKTLCNIFMENSAVEN